MERIEWNDSLTIGVELIDEQHKSLVQRLNDTSAAIEERQGEREIMKTLGFLIEYTDFHFSAEEKHMEATGYPGLEHQRVAHGRFKGTLKDLQEDLHEEGATKALAHSINTFLANWLVNHIKGVDLEFGAFLAEKGITLSGKD